MEKTGLVIPVYGEHKYETISAPGKLNKMFKSDGLWGGTSILTNL